MDFENFEKKFKELWADEKYKSLIKLGIYVLIMVFAVFTARATYGATVEEKKVTEKKKPENIIASFKDSKNYKATYIIDEKSYIYTYVNKELLKIDTDSYFINENGDLVNSLDSSLETPSFDLKFWRLNAAYIGELFEYGTEEYTKTYSSGKTEVEYLVSLQDFAATFDGASLDIEDTSVLKDKYVSLDVSIQNGHVIGIVINLNTYYTLLKKDALAYYDIEIAYSYGD